MDEPTHLTTDIGQYAIVPLWVVQSDLSATAVRVFALLAGKYAHRVTHDCWPSLQRIADDLAIHRNTAKAAIAELVDRGVLTRRQRGNEAGQTSNHYTLRFVAPDSFRASAGAPPRTENSPPSDRKLSPPRTENRPPPGLKTVHEPESGEPESENQRETARATADVSQRPAALIDSPLQWHRRHGSHVADMCDWVCLPQELASQYATRAGMTDAEVLAWAKQVRQDWQTAKRVPTGSMFEFWQARWAERHAASQPTAVPAGHTFSDLTQYRKDKAERDRKEAERIARYHEETRRQMAYLRALEEEIRNEQQQ